jgi:hypothetical protein
MFLELYRTAILETSTTRKDQHGSKDKKIFYFTLFPSGKDVMIQCESNGVEYFVKEKQSG